MDFETVVRRRSMVRAFAETPVAPDMPSPSLKRGRRPLAEVVHREGFGGAAR